jgi:hypothetical protein
MGETDTPATLAGYRDQVTEPMHEGYSFGDGEDAIDGAPERTQARRLRCGCSRSPCAPTSAR